METYYHLYHSLKIVLTLGKLFGLISCYVKPRKPTSNEKIFSTFYQIFIIILPTIFIYFFFQTHSHIKEVTKTKLDYDFHNIRIGVGIIGIFLIFCYSIIFSSKVSELIIKWHSLDNLIGDYLIKNKKRFILAQILLIFVIITVFATYVCIIMRSVKKISMVLFVKVIARFYLLMYNFMIASLIAFLFFTLKIAYSQLNNMLKSELLLRRQKLFVTVQKISQDERKIYTILQLTYEYFSFITGVILSERTIIFCVFCYKMVVYNYYTIFWQSGILVLCIILITFTADGIIEERNNLLMTLSCLDVLGVESRNEVFQQLQLLKWRLSHSSYEFTACGFFVVNKSLFVKIIGTIITYIVILAQFGVSSVDVNVVSNNNDTVF